MQQHWLTRPRSIRRLWVGFVIALALTVLGEYSVDPHPHFTVDRLLGFNAVYGFLACGGLILVAKLIGLVLKRADAYYAVGEDE